MRAQPSTNDHGQRAAAAASPRPVPLSLLAMIAVLALVAAACGGSESGGSTNPTAASRTDEGEPQYGGKVVFALEGETDGWDPISNIWSKNAHYVGSAVYDPLAIVGSDGDVEPYLAESIEHNEDFSQWTITVPEGIEFHNGERLDAEAVAANIEARRAAGLNIFLLQDLDTVEVVDDRTVTISLADAETGEPVSWVAFDHLFTQQSGYMVAPSMIGTGELAQQPVGTGPYVFESWAPDNAFVANRNESYWGTDEAGNQLPYLDQIEFQPIPDPLTRASSLETGDIDAMITGDVETARDLQDKGFDAVTDDIGEEGYIVLNTSLPPFDNPLAREALAYGTDPQELIDVVYEGELDVATGPFHPTERWYVEDTGYVEYDPARATELAAQYEAETGSPIRFTLTGAPDDGEKSALLQQQWEAIGAEVSIEALEFAQFSASLVGGDLQASFIANLGYADPDFMYVFFHPSFAEPGINFSRIEIDEVGEKFDLARATPGFEDRREAYAEAIRAWNAEHPTLWLYHQLNALLARPAVNGLTVAESVGFGRVDSKPFVANIWLDPEEPGTG